MYSYLYKKIDMGNIKYIEFYRVFINKLLFYFFISYKYEYFFFKKKMFIDIHKVNEKSYKYAPNTINRLHYNITKYYLQPLSL